MKNIFYLSVIINLCRRNIVKQVLERMFYVTNDKVNILIENEFVSCRHSPQRDRLNNKQTIRNFNQKYIL